MNLSSMIVFFTENLSLMRKLLLTDAVSPHGWDNALLRLVPSVMLTLCMGGLP